MALIEAMQDPHAVVIKAGQSGYGATVLLDGVDIADTVYRIDIALGAMQASRVTFEHFLAVEYSGDAEVDARLSLAGPRTLVVVKALRALAADIEAELREAIPST